MPESNVARTIHAACATDAGYFRHCAAMIASLLEFNPGVHLHVMCGDDVADEDRATLSSWAAERGGTVDCITPKSAIPPVMPGLRRLSRAAWLRLLLPEVLDSLSRVIYLDVDLVVRDSLRDLWELDLRGNAVGAVSDIPQVLDKEWHYVRFGFASAAEYFNSGVLLMDLDSFRRERIAARSMAYAAEHPERIVLADQDPLNVLLHDHWLTLPCRWNVLSPHYEGGASEMPYSAQDIEEALRRPAVIHFSGDWKPWHYRSKHPLRGLYAEYRARTPWPDWQQDGRTFKHRVLRMFPTAVQRNLTVAYWAARNLIGLRQPT